MREERANFRFLLAAMALLLVAAAISIISFISLVNAGESSNTENNQTVYVSTQVNDLPDSTKASSRNN